MFENIPQKDKNKMIKGVLIFSGLLIAIYIFALIFFPPTTTIIL